MTTNMRKTDLTILEAIKNKQSITVSNTFYQVDKKTNKGDLYLFNHLIAKIDYNINTVQLYSRGYLTATTKRRLNIFTHIKQKAGEWLVLIDKKNRANEKNKYVPFFEGIVVELAL